MIYRIGLILVLVCLNNGVEAQLMGRIMDRARQKVERKLEDKIIEEVSEEITRRAYRPFEKAVDDALRQKYSDSLNNGEPVDWEKMGEAYSAFLSGLNKTATIPEQYNFDLTQEVEIIDYNKQRSFIKLHYSKDAPIMGMENTENDNAQQLIVMDMKYDVLVIFTTDKKGKKTGQAVPGLLAFSSSLTKNISEDSTLTVKIQKTGKTKKIFGYECDEYSGENQDEWVTVYVAKGFPAEYLSVYSAYLQKFAPPAYLENNKAISGMLLQSENIRKDDAGKRFQWNTKKTVEKSFVIRKEDFQFTEISK